MKQHKFLTPKQGTAYLQALVIMFAITLVIGAAIPIFSATSISAAINLLENSGHKVLAANEYDSILTKLDDIKALGSSLYNHIEGETSESFIFPEDTDTPVIITAGTSPNAFGDWVEISDGNASTLSSKFTTNLGFICEITCTEHSAKGKRYIIEIAYDNEGTKKVILRGRADVSNGLIDEKSTEIPEGSTLYYRAMCEKADATLEATFRYHYYPQQLL